MRKRSSRVTRPAVALLAPNQHAALMIGPRLHLQQILDNVVSIDFQISVLGVYNLASALSTLQQDAQKQRIYGAAQDLMALLIQEQRPPLPAESAYLRQSFNTADNMIGIQNKRQLLRALDLAQNTIFPKQPAPSSCA